jgi:hypothetical protein
LSGKRKKAPETSKCIILVAGFVFAAHILLASGIILLGDGAQAVDLMSACMPVYLAVVAGYYGKAGVENVHKIKMSDNKSGLNG